MFSHTHTINATPEEIWAVLTDFPSHEHWNPQLTILLGAPVVGSLLQAVTNKGVKFTPTVIDVDAPHRLEWKGNFLVPGISDGVHAWNLTPTGDGATAVTQSENFTGILSWLANRVFDLDTDFAESNQALAAEVERRRHEQN